MDDTLEPQTTDADELVYKDTFSLSKFARKNGTQLGIFAVFLALWALFIFAAPRTFLSANIYWAFMATIPFFAIMAMPLTITLGAILLLGDTMDVRFLAYFLGFFALVGGIGAIINSFRLRSLQKDADAAREARGID